MSSRSSIRAVATGAALIDVLALGLVAWGIPFGALAGLLLHLAAAMNVRRSLRKSVGRRAHGQLVFAAALALPVFGPLLSWCLPAPGAPVARPESKELFDAYDALVHHKVERPRRSQFVGDFARDFAHFANVESYAAVLERGTVAQKRDILKRLVASEQPRHLRLARSCLTDPDPEVRLLAYGELQNVEQALYRELDRARQRAYDAPDDPDARRAPARAHRHLAASGVLDPTIAAWHAREATRIELKRAPAPDGVAEATTPSLSSVPTEELPDPAAQAEEAFRLRDFEHVRMHAKELTVELRRLPDWIAALMPEEAVA